MRVSREGIPWREYRWGHLIPALPVSLLIHAYLMLIRATSRDRRLGPGQLPKGSILAVFHPEWLYFPITKKTWLDIFARSGGMAWVGIHHFLSYFGSSTVYLWGFRAIRYDRRNPLKPFQMVMKFLKENPETLFAIRTDSGSPYNKVRPSLVVMALENNRPIVCARQMGNRNIVWNQHYIPLPFSEIYTAISEPIFPEELRGIPVEAAVEKVQKVMDGLMAQIKGSQSPPARRLDEGAYSYPTR